jgi:hypothetical protein
MALAAIQSDLNLALDRQRERFADVPGDMPDSIGEVAAIAGEAFCTLWRCARAAVHITIHSLRAAWFSAAFGWSAFFGLVGWHTYLKGMTL